MKRKWNSDGERFWQSLHKHWGSAGEIDATVTNKSEQHVCVWVDLAGCVCARLKILIDAASNMTATHNTSVVPLTASVCVCLCVSFGLLVLLCDREIRGKKKKYFLSAVCVWVGFILQDLILLLLEYSKGRIITLYFSFDYFRSGDIS